MARGRRKWKPKETLEYESLLDLILDKRIYLVNYYGFVVKMNTTWTDWVRDRLTHVGQNAVGIMFGGCLVILPADVAVNNLGYLRPVGGAPKTFARDRKGYACVRSTEGPARDVRR